MSSLLPRRAFPFMVSDGVDGQNDSGAMSRYESTSVGQEAPSCTFVPSKTSGGGIAVWLHELVSTLSLASTSDNIASSKQKATVRSVESIQLMKTADK